MGPAYLMYGYEKCKDGEGPTNALCCSGLQKDEWLMYKGPIVCGAVGGGWYKWCGAAQIWVIGGGTIQWGSVCIRHLQHTFNLSISQIISNNTLLHKISVS